MKTHRVGAALAVFLLCAGARASADPAGGPSPAESLQAEARAAHAAAAESIAAMDFTAARMQAALRKARARGHREEIACVDEALSRADVATRRAREEARGADEAYARGDAVEGRRAVERIARAREASRHAAQAGEMCFLDASARAATATQVRVTVDPTLPPETASR